VTVKSTSKAAHLDNNESGLNQTKRTKIFEFVYSNPGCSRSDIERGLIDMKINCVCGRVNELLMAGSIHENGCKHDSVTGRSVNRLYAGRKAAAA
jgi:predicted transcriptional regulator